MAAVARHCPHQGRQAPSTRLQPLIPFERLMTPPLGQHWRDLDRALPGSAPARTGASAYGATPVS